MGIALVVGEQYAFARFRRQFIEAMRELADAFSLDRAQFRIDGVAVGKCHRSEAHTSELQSLMRNSYAVFCLKKKTLNESTHQIRSLSTHILLITTLSYLTTAQTTEQH